jgi:glycosyltransferase involved in cell wall biosynthesis
MTAQVIRGDRALLHFDAIPAMPMSRDRRVTLVIPAKNEARNIGWVLERVPLTVDEIVLVDGRSTDETVAVARALRPDIVVVNDERPGKGAALRAGFEAASGDYVVMIDADGSMDPGEIDMFVDYLDRGADLVKGSRFMEGGGTADMSLLRAMGNRALLAIANGLVGSAHTDLCYGMAAFKRERVIALELDAIGFEIETQLFLRAIRNGLLVLEAPSFEAPRRFGTSNLNTFRDGWRVLKTIFSERLRPVSAGRTVGIMESGPIEPLVE